MVVAKLVAGLAKRQMCEQRSATAALKCLCSHTHPAPPSSVSTCLLAEKASSTTYFGTSSLIQSFFKPFDKIWQLFFPLLSHVGFSLCQQAKSANVQLFVSNSCCSSRLSKLLVPHICCINCFLSGTSSCECQAFLHLFGCSCAGGPATLRLATCIA